MTTKTFVLSLIVFLSFSRINGQNPHNTPTQTIRGTVTDNVSGAPLYGATIMLENTQPVKGATSDFDGHFKIPDVPVGVVQLQVRLTGYKSQYIAQLKLNSGKELVIQISMEEEIYSMAAVEVVDVKEKNEAVNSMSGTSTRAFSVEETQKFAAAVNDPGRMATSFAGVIGADDGNNNISIRGNSPYGLLWRMEGIDIPNPNHFAAPATSGGGISILSAQLLSNSDFMTGAFSAEYGNALSGVFDLRLRKGNNEKREYTFQAGFLGIDAAVEGPFSKNYQGSYLINYRYSTLSLLSQLGVGVGDGITNFQDLSFNLFLPTSKAGNFSIFGFGGKSDQVFRIEQDTSKWNGALTLNEDNYFSNTGAVGLKHVLIINGNHSLQNTVLLSGNSMGYRVAEFTRNLESKEINKDQYTQSKITYNSVWNWKINARSSMRTGAYFNRAGFNLTNEYFEEESQEWQRPLSVQSSMPTIQTFTQWRYKWSESIQSLVGLHSIWAPSTKSSSIEPRMSVRYTSKKNHTWSLGYGLHSQTQPLGVYFAEVKENGRTRRPNEHLGFNKAHHVVLGYDHRINDKLHAKIEVYHQNLFNIAIEDRDQSSMSTLNMEYNYILEPLRNTGKGRNNGIELTVEQFTHKGMYFLLSGALFQSQYLAADQVWRSTRFDAGRSLAFTAGKEWKMGGEEKNRTFGLNIRTIYTGGLRRTPIDLSASREAGEAVYIESKAYEIRMADYFRTDLKLSYRVNKKKSTKTISLDLQNATNRKNIGGFYFDEKENNIKTWNMVPLIPILSYKVEF